MRYRTNCRIVFSIQHDIQPRLLLMYAYVFCASGGDDGDYRFSSLMSIGVCVRVSVFCSRYMERDPVRGMDSFAAFDEVLVQAKHKKVDFVLLGGDLFHENKPSRRTLYRTMDILRNRCMGPEPVSFQIISEQAQNFKLPMENVKERQVTRSRVVYLHGCVFLVCALLGLCKYLCKILSSPASNYFTCHQPCRA